jgi:hypothetical protein
MLIGTMNHHVSHQNSIVHKEENRQNQAVSATDKTDNISKTEASRQEPSKSSGSLNEPHYEYIPSGDRPENHSGTYRLEKDESGKQKIVYDRPVTAQKSEQTSGGENEKVSAAEIQGKSEQLLDVAEEPNEDSVPPEGKEYSEKSDDKKTEECTTNTDKVNAEIKKLKEEKQQLQQQLISTHDDEDKCKKLQSRLSQVEAELSAKDNDAYRKQNAIINL